MRKIFVLLAAAILSFGASSAIANHIEQPNFPRKPNQETELVLKMDDFSCGNLYIFQYDAGEKQHWKFYYLGDNFSHKPITVIFADEREAAEEKSGIIKVWVDRDRDGHFDEKFGDGAKVFEKYPSPCQIVGTST